MTIKQEFALQILGWLVQPEDQETVLEVIHERDGHVTVTRRFNSRAALRRYQHFSAIRGNPYGDRAIRWLMRAAAEMA